MKVVLIALGAIFFVFGAVDLIGSFANFDLWGGFLGIQLPELLWKYSAYIEMIIGYIFFKIGSSMSSDEE